MGNYRELFFDKQDQLLKVMQKAIKLQEEREKLEALLDTALEHFSHGWLALEKQGMVTYKDPDVFPPSVSDEVGSASYHFAAVADTVKRAYEIITAEQSAHWTRAYCSCKNSDSITYGDCKYCTTCNRPCQ